MNEIRLTTVAQQTDSFMRSRVSSPGSFIVNFMINTHVSFIEKADCFDSFFEDGALLV